MPGRYAGRQFGLRGERIADGVFTDLSRKSNGCGTFRAILSEMSPNNQRFFYLLAGEVL